MRIHSNTTQDEDGTHRVQLTLTWDGFPTSDDADDFSAMAEALAELELGDLSWH